MEHYNVLNQIPAVSVDAIIKANISAYWFKSVPDNLPLSTCEDID